MRNFIINSRPLSFNSCKGLKKANYKTALETAFKRFNSAHNMLNSELYSIVYYFFNKNLKLDADNLSKPVWDSLCGFLFADDKQIKLRISGSYDLTKGGYNLIDFTRLQGDLLGELLESLENKDHTVYIECGRIKPSMYKFNVE